MSPTLFDREGFIDMDIYGVIGWPIKHSLSPAMHNAAFKKLDIDAEYKAFPVKPEELEDFLLNRKDVKGFNITIPHKVKAKEILEKKFPVGSDIDSVKLSGAVNTVKRIGDKLEYCNTDVLGFLKSLYVDLKFEFREENKNVFIVGCGGAGRAIIAGLTSGDRKCKKIYVYDNNVDVVKSVTQSFSEFSDLSGKLEFIYKKEGIPNVMKECQLLVNASPIGMKKGDFSIIDKNLLHKELSVYDLVYNRETELVKDAKSLGLRAVNGKGMLLYQGASSFEFWTGKKAPIEVMREALDKAIK